MIKELIHDEAILSQKSEKANEADLPVAKDLYDTFMEHSEECVCLAANMIGELKRIIVINNLGEPLVMINPMITDKKQPFVTSEECLSVSGTHQVKRYKRIKVNYRDEQFELHTETFRDYTAQIIQHVVDHCNGILV